MKKFNPTFPDFPHMLHGGDYNPDQWIDTPEIWDEDMRLMKLAHCNEMTMGIFSWSELEPQEGVFDFSTLDTLMDKIYKNGGRVILATPSGARPRWLSEKYPEVLRVNDEFQKEHYRRRHNHCPSSEIYREKVRIINEKLAERYENHPALIGWHLSNEYTAGCYCEKCTENFRKWLKEKYGTVEKLNQQLWTVFWSHRVYDFSQIEPPALKLGDPSVQGLTLDWKRFSSDMILDFMKDEIKAVRKFSQKPITTNCMGFYQGLNYRDFAKELDFYSNDTYPFWAQGVRETALTTAANCDYCRGMKHGQPFIMMESAPGINNSAVHFAKVKTDEQQLLEAVKFISHGSDSVMYFQWRKGRGAWEKFHGAVVDHYGKEDTRVFKNVTKVGEMLEKLDGVVGTGIKSDVGIVYDMETSWALDGNTNLFNWDTNPMGYLSTTKAFYKAFYEKNISCDIIGYREDFSKYKVLVLPVPYLMTDVLSAKIKAFVQKGGTVISTYLTAVANENDLCYIGGAPGAGLMDLFGLRVDEVDSYQNPESMHSRPHTAENSVFYNGKEYPLKGIAESVVPTTATPVATYKNTLYMSDGALFKNIYGKGVAYYMAFQDDEGTFQADWITEIAKECGLTPPIDADFDDGICIKCREGDGERYFFITNETESAKSVTLKNTYKNLLTEEIVEGTQTLKSCGFLILTE